MGWKSLFSGNSARDRIMTSVVENVADVCRDCQCSQCYLPDCAALDYAKTTTNITLELQIQTGHPREFPLNDKFKGFVLSFKIFKYFIPGYGL